jgi:hypothetical protein
MNEAEPKRRLDYMPMYPDGTGGHSGSDTSQARAERERDNGTKSFREIETLSWLALAGENGLTYAELGRKADWHHGQSSSVLSTLHKTGRVARLTTRRNGAKVYVLPVYGETAPTEPHGGRKVERDAAIKQVLAARAFIEEWERKAYVGGQATSHRWEDLGTLQQITAVLFPEREVR